LSQQGRNKVKYGYSIVIGCAALVRIINNSGSSSNDDDGNGNGINIGKGFTNIKAITAMRICIHKPSTVSKSSIMPFAMRAATTSAWTFTATKTT
jgi:hypothetical protein